jgi:hypothetical protein
MVNHSPSQSAAQLQNRIDDERRIGHHEPGIRFISDLIGIEQRQMEGNYIKKTAAEMPPPEAAGLEAVYLDSLPNLVPRQLGLGAIV